MFKYFKTVVVFIFFINIGFSQQNEKSALLEFTIVIEGSSFPLYGQVILLENETGLWKDTLFIDEHGKAQIEIFNFSDTLTVTIESGQFEDKIGRVAMSPDKRNHYLVGLVRKNENVLLKNYLQDL